MSQVDTSKFWVIAIVSNPVRYSSRYRLFAEHLARLKAANANVIIVEQAFGAREFLFTESTREDHVQLRTFDELWHKENMINLGVQRLPPDCEYLAWIDGDVEFTRPDWIEETVQQLQHYHFVQMFSHAIDLGPNHETIKVHAGFCHNYVKGIVERENTDASGYFAGRYYGHPGYAWACRKEAWDFVGGLIDFAILGSGDHHMALALVGEVEYSRPSTVSASYQVMLKLWQDNAERNIQRDIGYVPGTLIHHWHGKKRDRQYSDRWKLLVNNTFSPLQDIKRDWQGLWQLAGNKPRFRDNVRGYFRSRNEDSIDLE